jgi:FAD/FMN-containing dehydrogenase
MSDFTGLATAGRVATPQDADWDEARLAWNLAADQNPAAIAFVESAEDVAKAVAFAAQNGVRVAGQGTGHGAGAMAPLDGALLIKTERMRGVEIDPEARTARVQAGVLAMELSAAATEHGLSFLPGSAPDVGVTGYTLGGGLSWFGRKHGFACNRVRAIELVTADGERRQVDADNEPDLFWALRGGGGNFAIVTALHLDLVPIADVYAGALLFEAEAGADGVRAYRAWAEALPDEVTSIVRFIRPPDIPDVPEPLRNRAMLTVTATCIGGEEDGRRAIEPLLEIGEPIMNTFGQMPAAELGHINMEPEHPVPGLGHHQVLTGLPDEAIDVLVRLTGADSGTPLLLTEVRHLGGALGRPDPDGGALSHVDAAYVAFSLGMPMAPELVEAIGGRLDAIEEALAPWTAEGGYFNFAERPCDVDAILPPDVCARLGEVKRRYDPDRIFRANHELALAG